MKASRVFFSALAFLFAVLCAVTFVVGFFLASKNQQQQPPPEDPIATAVSQPRFTLHALQQVSPHSEVGILVDNITGQQYLYCTSLGYNSHPNTIAITPLLEPDTNAP